MNDLIGERMEQVYQENDGKQYDPFNEKLELKLQKVLRKMPKKQEKVLFDYLTDTSNKCSDLNEFYYRMGLRDGLKLKEAMRAMLDALTESGKDGVYNPLHNDRRFDPEHSEHIDNERVRQNIYWDCYQGYTTMADRGKEDNFSFNQIELAYYVEHYSDYRM